MPISVLADRPFVRKDRGNPCWTQRSGTDLTTTTKSFRRGSETRQHKVRSTSTPFFCCVAGFITQQFRSIHFYRGVFGGLKAIWC